MPIETTSNTKEVQTEVISMNIKQEYKKLKAIYAKLTQKIDGIKLESQMYKYNEQKFKNDDQRVSYYTGLASFLIL